MKNRLLQLTLLLVVMFTVKSVSYAQGGCSNITFSFEEYEPCKFRAKYSNTSECYIEIRYLLESGTFASYSVNSAAGFTLEVISPSELWVHHTGGFMPLGDQVPLLFTLPYDLNTTIGVAYLDDCAQLGCEVFGGFPIESCPLPLDASITGVKYSECSNLPFSNQPTLPGWSIQLLDADQNLLAEQQTATDGTYGFYDLPPGQYLVKEVAQPGWTPNVPASGQYAIDLAVSQQAVRNFGNCYTNGSISGTVYETCDSVPYTNQPVLSGWTVYLTTIDNIVLDSAVTGSTGTYTFADRPPGNYYVKGWDAQGNWTPSVPASGQSIVNLLPSGNEVRNFGLCPECSCSDVYTNLIHIDPCLWRLQVQNSNDVCYRNLRVSIDTGSIAGWEVLLPDWTVVQIDSQTIQLNPPGNVLPLGASFPLELMASGSDKYIITIEIPRADNPDSSCVSIFSYPCLPVIPAPCCPAGSTYGTELVQNPDFQLGNQDFTNNYTYFTPGGATMIGKYSVLEPAQVFTANSQWACTDHTSGSSTGKMLVVDGYAGPIAWQQIVPVTPGASYSFSAWFNNLVYPPKNYDDPQMALFVDGVQVAGPLNLPETPDQWVWLCGEWTAGSSATATLSIRMLATGSIGNDVGIDDISFRQCIPPPPCQVSVSVTPLNNCGLVTVTAVTSGPQPVSYQWCDGSVTGSQTLQLPCGPTTFCVTATCADGSTSTASTTFVVTDAIPPLCKTVPGFGVVLDPDCTYTLTPGQIDGGSTDDCFIQSMSISPAVLTGCGNTTITLTVTDWCGNTSTCTTGVQTIEAIPPTITNCPPPITIGGLVGPNGLCQGVLPPPPVTATDNCPGAVTVTNDAPAGGVFPVGVNTVTYTATDQCGNTATCQWVVTVICLPGACAACPAPSNPGPNLVLNGNFELGNNGQFLSGYPYFPAGGPTTIGSYSVLTSAQVPLANSQWACTDHSTGTQMLIVDGINSSSDVAWATVSPLTVQPNSTYAFCAFVNNIVLPSKDYDDPILSVYINNQLVGTTLTIPENPDVWIPIGGLWNSGIWTAATIEIRVGFTSSIGTDFAIDDINFQLCGTPCTADFNFMYNGCGKVSFNGFGNGTPPFVYSWNFGDPNSGANNTSNLQNPMHQFSAPGSYTVTLTVTDAAGCVATYSATVVIPQFPTTVPVTGSPLSICQGQTTTLIASGGGTYLWSPGGQTTASILVNPASTTTYTVQVTDANGCTATGSATVTVKPAPLADAGPDQTVCQWQGAVLLASGGGTYQWSPNGSTANPYTTAPVQSNTTYTVTVTGSNGCTATDQVNVNVIICDCVTNTIVQNGDFSAANACVLPDQDIQNAANWSSIWPAPGYSTGDLYNQINCFPPFNNPVTPAGQGNFAGIWCKPHPQRVWREGIMNQLTPGQEIAPNTGSYEISMKIACVAPFSGTARLAVYGVAQGSTTTITGITGTNPLQGASPANTALFQGPAGGVWLGTYFLTPGNCSATGFSTFPVTFNSNILPGTIDRIFITRDDGAGGITFVAIDDVCITPKFDSVTCQCGQLDFAQFWQQWNWSSAIGASQPAITVPCPKAGANYSIHGAYHCAPDQCGNNTFSWKLDRPAPLPDLTGTTSWVPYPYFYVPINPADCTASGTYQLTVTRNCGGTTCSKVFNFKLDNCPCDCDDLKADVTYGFSVSNVIFPPGGCKRRLKPLALCPNDMVTWIVPGGTVTSIGNAPVTVNFPASGTYYVCMVVKRTEQDGTQCFWENCRNVIVNCSSGPLEPVVSFCTDTPVKNAGFNDGVVEGYLNEWGAVTDWEMAPNVGDGLAYAVDSSGAQNEGHVVLVGGAGNFAGVMQEITLALDSFTILNFEAINYLGAAMPAGTRIEVRLQKYPYTDPTAGPQILLSQPMVDSSGWIRYETSQMLAVDSSLHYLVICVQNNDETQRSVVGIDNFELCSSASSDAPETKNPEHYLRIYPNPNPGKFTVQLSDPAPSGTSFRIVDVTGRVMRTQMAQTGATVQNLQAETLPAGLYFLQYVAEGGIMAVEKFVKQ